MCGEKEWWAIIISSTGARLKNMKNEDSKDGEQVNN
jgi:hypothetical protein